VSVNVPIVAFTGAAFVFISDFSLAVQHSVRETVTLRGQVVQIVFVIGSNITDAISTSVGIRSVRVAILNSVGQAMVIGVLIVTDLTGITIILFRDLLGTINEGG
jgi:ABC-type Fe3+-siderophore transport system permease subunit